LGISKAEYIKQLSSKLNLNNEYTPKKSFDASTGTPIKSGKNTNKFIFDNFENVDKDDPNSKVYSKEIKEEEKPTVIDQKINKIENFEEQKLNSDTHEAQISSRCFIF
jgi:hypothetical protein